MNRFRDFLNLAEEHDGLLPPWWSEPKRRECGKMEGEMGADGARIGGL